MRDCPSGKLLAAVFASLEASGGLAAEAAERAWKGARAPSSHTRSPHALLSSLSKVRARAKLRPLKHYLQKSDADHSKLALGITVHLPRYTQYRL